MQLYLIGTSGNVGSETLESLGINHAKSVDWVKKCGLRLRQLRDFVLAAAMSQEPSELQLQ